MNLTLNLKEIIIKNKSQILNIIEKIMIIFLLAFVTIFQ